MWGPSVPLGRPKVEVWVDVSDSTRGASYRDADGLERVLGRLMPGLTASAVREIKNGDEWPAAQDATDAVVVLTDARLTGEPAIGLPVYIVRDSQLLDPPDAAVVALEQAGPRVEAVVRGPAGTWFQWDDGPKEPLRFPVRRVATDAMPGVVKTIRVGGVAMDRWPENDAAQIVPLAEKGRRIWHGKTVPAGFESFDPATGINSADLLIWAESDLPSKDLQADVRRAVADGMTLLVAPGPAAWDDPAWAASDWANALPLQPQVLEAKPFVILVDASGSMAQGNRAADAAKAVRQVISVLPDEARVTVKTVGSTGRTLFAGLAPSDALRALPDQLMAPGGPTAVEQAVAEYLAADVRGVLVVTDGEIPFQNAAALGGLTSRCTHPVSWWLGGWGAGVEGGSPAAPETMAAIARATGGTVISADNNPSGVRRGLEEWALAGRGKVFRPQPGTMEWIPPATAGQDPVEGWAMTDISQGSVALAGIAAPPTTMVGMKQIGVGKVIAVSAGLPAARLARLAEPFGPVWDTGSAAEMRREGDHLRIKAATPASLFSVYVDGQSVPLLPDGCTAALADSAQPRIATTVTASGSIAGRIPVSGKGPAELDSVGFDEVAALRFATATGGAVVNDNASILNQLPRKHLALRPVFCAAGVLLALATLWVARRR